MAKYRYTPYGELLTSLSSGTDVSKYKYTAQELDDTGLYYYNSHFYDPEIGRFISADSIVPDPTDTQAFNRYMYVEGNPVKYNDPTGYYYDDYYYYYYYGYYLQDNNAWGQYCNSQGYYGYDYYSYSSYDNTNSTDTPNNPPASSPDTPDETDSDLSAENIGEEDTESAQSEAVEEVVEGDDDSGISNIPNNEVDVNNVIELAEDMQAANELIDATINDPIKDYVAPPNENDNIFQQGVQEVKREYNKAVQKYEALEVNNPQAAENIKNGGLLIWDVAKSVYKGEEDIGQRDFGWSKKFDFYP